MHHDLHPDVKCTSELLFEIVAGAVEAKVNEM